MCALRSSSRATRPVSSNVLPQPASHNIARIVCKNTPVRPPSSRRRRRRRGSERAEGCRGVDARCGGLAAGGAVCPAGPAAAARRPDPRGRPGHPGGAGTPHHGLSSKTTALITSDCDAMRTHEHQMALITSECVPLGLPARRGGRPAAGPPAAPAAGGGQPSPGRPALRRAGLAGPARTACPGRNGPERAASPGARHL